MNYSDYNNHYNEYSQAGLSQDEIGDYLTPAEPAAGESISQNFMRNCPLASPSPIKKKSRNSTRRSGQFSSTNTLEGISEFQSTCSSHCSDIETFEDMPNLSQCDQQNVSNPASTNIEDGFSNVFSQSEMLADGFKTLNMKSASPPSINIKEDGEFSLKSLSGSWRSANEDMEGAGNNAGSNNSVFNNNQNHLDKTNQSDYQNQNQQQQQQEITKMVSIPQCNVNPFSSDNDSTHLETTENSRKRGRQRNLKILCRTSLDGDEIDAPSVSRYVMDFEQKEIIGGGNFSVVYLCKKRIDGCLYCLKKSRHSLQTKAQVHQSLREVFALSTLSKCEHFVRYYDSWLEDNHLFIVTEVYEKGSLADKAWRKSNFYEFSELEILKILNDICLGLDYMHKKGLVHLDIKPSNLFITDSGDYIIGDLGNVCQISDLKSLKVLEGDEIYMSKEFLEEGYFNKKNIENLNIPAADVFSLGISILELMQRKRLPRSGIEWQRLRNGKIDFLPEDYSHILCTLIMKMLDPQPDKRPTVNEILINVKLWMSNYCNSNNNYESNRNSINNDENGNEKLQSIIEKQKQKIQELENLISHLT